MKNNKKVFILGASSDIGLSIMRIYQKYNYKVLAHYNNGNKNFFKYTKKNKIKTIKFNFLTSNRKIEKFAKKKRIQKIWYINKCFSTYKRNFFYKHQNKRS